MRVYTVPIDAVAVTATQDFFYLLASSTVPFMLLELELNQKTLTAWEAKDVTFRRLPATVTAGSGGASVTPVPRLPNDAAATTTARRNDTTVATTSGSNTIMEGRDFIFLNGLYWSAQSLDLAPRFAPSTAWVCRLGTAPSGSMTVSGTVVFAEDV